MRSLVCLLSVSALVACQRPAETRPAGKAPEAAGGGAASSGAGLRLAEGHVVASWDGGQLTYGELMKKKESSFKKLHNKYLSDLHTAERQELESFLVEALVAKKAGGKTVEEYLTGIAGSPEVNEQEIQEFYDKNVRQSGQPLEAIRDRIKMYLEGQKKQTAVRAEIDKLKAEAHVKMTLPPPQMSAASFDLAGRPMKGNPSAKVTLVEFSDFECPYCSRAVPGVEALLKAYPNDVKVYFLHYPLSFHKAAMPSAIASMCAHKQDKFWPFHDKLFSNQQGLDELFFKSAAKELGMDEGKFTACLSDPATKAEVEKDQAMGNNAGVEGTPSFFINGVAYAEGVPTVDALKAYVEN